MKLKSLRMLAVAVAALLLVPGLLGCQDGGRSSAPSSETGGEQGVNLNGLEIVFAGLEGFYIPTDETSEDYETMMDYKAEVEEHFNCKIKVEVYSPWDTYFQKLQDMTMAGEVIGDIVHFDNYIYPKVMLSGILMPLQDYMDVKDYDFWDQEMEQYFLYNDNVYGVSKKASGLPAAFMFYNKTLFHEKGLDAKYDIPQLIEDKQWTWETFQQILRDSTMDTDGDNKTDIYGLSGQGLQFGRLTNYFVRANGGAYTRMEDGKVVFTAEEPQFLEAMEFMHTLTFTDKVIGQSAEWRSYDSTAMFTRGESMFYAATNWHIQTLKAMVPEGTVISITPIPIGPSAGGDYINFNDNATVYGMPSTAEHPEEAGMVFEYWLRNNPLQEKTARESYASDVMDVESLDVVEMLASKPKVVEFSTSGYTNLMNFMLGEHGIPDMVSPSTFIQENKDPIVQEIERTWAAKE